MADPRPLAATNASMRPADEIAASTTATARTAAAPTQADALASALAFIETHGVVLASARGDAPRLIDAIAGEAIVGNWWSHPKANAIYHVLEQASASPDVLACRLVDGKVTLVHRRLWPALVRIADRFAPDRIAQVSNEHTASGRHVAQHVPFPDWVPAEVAQQAASLDSDVAAAALCRWLPSSSARPARKHG